MEHLIKIPVEIPPIKDHTALEENKNLQKKGSIWDQGINQEILNEFRKQPLKKKELTIYLLRSLVSSAQEETSFAPKSTGQHNP